MEWYCGVGFGLIVSGLLFSAFSAYTEEAALRQSKYQLTDDGVLVLFQYVCRLRFSLQQVLLWTIEWTDIQGYTDAELSGPMQPIVKGPSPPFINQGMKRKIVLDY